MKVSFANIQNDISVSAFCLMMMFGTFLNDEFFPILVRKIFFFFLVMVLLVRVHLLHSCPILSNPLLLFAFLPFVSYASVLMDSQ